MVALSNEGSNAEVLDFYWFIFIRGISEYLERYQHIRAIHKVCWFSQHNNDFSKFGYKIVTDETEIRFLVNIIKDYEQQRNRRFNESSKSPIRLV